MFKFHPQYDHILHRILEEIPNAIFFLAEGKKNETEQLKSRWEKISTLILKRTIIYPFVDFDNFLEILKSMDIMLDPFFFGMGNTFFQSMAFGIPVVTMPSNHARTRSVFAGYKQMNIKDPPVANSPEEYVSICKKLAFNPSYRENISKQILSESGEKLFNDKIIHKEYIDFFNQSINAARNGELLSSDWKSKDAGD